MRAERFFAVEVKGQPFILDISTMCVAPWCSYLGAERQSLEWNLDAKKSSGYSFVELVLKGKGAE